MPRCVSSCKGLSETNCVNRCSYVNKRKYCRLKGTFKMAKPGCTVVQKLSKRAAKTKSENAIRTFMKQTTVKRKAHFLKTLCADSGACFAFGTEVERLMSFFEFHTFKYAFALRNLGNVSANGFVKEVAYDREGYKAYAALKSSIKASSDNLAYEYLVGEFINTQSKRFPCFIDTYGLFKYASVAEQLNVKTNHPDLSGLVPINPTQYNVVCQDSELIGLLVQHVPHARSMLSLIKTDFLAYEALYAYYQIYFTLHQLRHTFTHYDLHSENVLLYEPTAGGYIQYHFHLPTENVVFKSKYMVKIIDYGRSFFPGAHNYHTNLCQTFECIPNCGATKGLGWMNHRPATKKRYFINSLHKNESHDLRLLYHCSVQFDDDEKDDFLYHFPEATPMFNVFEQVRCVDFYGTPENIHHQPNKINNISDAELRFRHLVQQNVQNNDARYAGSNKIGELHIYTDGRPIRFEKSQ